MLTFDYALNWIHQVIITHFSQSSNRPKSEHEQLKWKSLAFWDTARPGRYVACEENTENGLAFKAEQKGKICKTKCVDKQCSLLINYNNKNICKDRPGNLNILAKLTFLVEFQRLKENSAFNLNSP